MNFREIKLALEMPFPKEQIHWRVGSRNRDKTRGIPLAYIDARDAMRRLDEVVGIAGWQDRYQHLDSGIVVCEIGLLLDGQWIWKANGAGDTQVEAEKGKLSDAFKRAAVLWGVGRYLYSLPNEWLPLDENGNKFKTTPTLPDWATPEQYALTMFKREELTGWDIPMLEAVRIVKEGIASKDFYAAGEAWYELEQHERDKLWIATQKNGPFTTHERKVIQEDLRKAYYGDKEAAA